MLRAYNLAMHPAVTALERFELERRLGEGGTGTVYKAYDRARGMHVALKELHHVDATRIYAFKREFRALTGLYHPNIVTLYELLADGDRWLLSMELVEGSDLVTYVRGRERRRVLTPISVPTLFQIADTQMLPRVSTLPQPGLADTATSQPELQHHRDTLPGPALATSPVTVDTLASEATATPGDIPREIPTEGSGRHALSEGSGRHALVVDTTRKAAPSPELVERLHAVLRQLADALAVIHAAGLVHRDLKPPNVLVTPQGRVVVMDFGIVAEIDKPRDPTTDGMLLGTPAYMAPEQARGAPPSAAADWYAVGVMMYQCLTGSLPFTGSLPDILTLKQKRDPAPPSSLVANVPPALDELCMALLRRNPDHRPGGAEVLARLAASTAIPAISAAPVLRDGLAHCFVGRTRERATVRELFDRAAAGATAVAMVEGSSGMGKSSLVSRFIDDLDQPALVLAGRCHERESLPYKAFDGVLDSLILHLIAQPAAERAQLAAASAAAPMRSLIRSFPVLRKVPELADLPAGASASDDRDNAALALRQLVAALGRRQPVIVRIEDLQWADPDSLELLSRLLADPPPHLLVVITVRAEALATPGGQPLVELATALERRGLARRIALGPLSGREQAELGARLGLGEHAELWRESHGHPLLLTELAWYVQQAPERIGSAGALTVEQVIRRRVAALAPPARALLVAIAVAGEPTPLGALGEAAGLTAAEREHAAAALCAGHLARASHRHSEPWLDAYHDTICEAVQPTLTPTERAHVHLQLARTLEALRSAVCDKGADAADAGEDMVWACGARLARHWRDAGEPVRAARYLVTAADRAAQQLALAHAVEMYREALALMSAHAAGTADTAATSGATAGTAAHAAEPAEHARLRLDAYLGLAQTLRELQSSPQELRVALDQAEPLAHALGQDAALGSIHYLRGMLLFATGSHAQALVEQEQALAHARRAGSLELEAKALSGIADAHLTARIWSRSQTYFEASIALCRQLGLISLEASNLAVLGYLRWFHNDLYRAIELFQQGLVLAEQCGSRRAEALLRGACLPSVLFEMDRLDEADRESALGLRIAREHGFAGFIGHSLALQARVMVWRGRRQAALATIEESLGLAHQTRYWLLAPMTMGLLVQVADTPRVRAEALAECDRLLARGNGAMSLLGMCADLIEAALETGELDLVERYTAHMIELTAHDCLPWAELTIARGRALAAHQRGRRDRALAAELRRVHDEMLAVGRRLLARALASALAEQG